MEEDIGDTIGRLVAAVERQDEAASKVVFTEIAVRAFRLIERAVKALEDIAEYKAQELVR